MTGLRKEYIMGQLLKTLSGYPKAKGYYMIDELSVDPFGWITIADLAREGDFWVKGIKEIGTESKSIEILAEIIYQYLIEWEVFNFHLMFRGQDNFVHRTDFYLLPKKIEDLLWEERFSY